MQSQLAEPCTIPVQFSAFDRTSDARCLLSPAEVALALARAEAT